MINERYRKREKEKKSGIKRRAKRKKSEKKQSRNFPLPIINGIKSYIHIHDIPYLQHHNLPIFIYLIHPYTLPTTYLRQTSPTSKAQTKKRSENQMRICSKGIDSTTYRVHRSLMMRFLRPCSIIHAYMQNSPNVEG